MGTRKKTPSTQISPPLELVVQGGGGDFSRTATVELRTGRCIAEVSSRDWRVKGAGWTTHSVALVIPRRDLAVLRAAARAISAAGDTQHREQFAQQGVSFTARS